MSLGNVHILNDCQTLNFSQIACNFPNRTERLKSTIGFSTICDSFIFTLRHHMPNRIWNGMERKAEDWEFNRKLVSCSKANSVSAVVFAGSLFRAYGQFVWMHNLVRLHFKRPTIYQNSKFWSDPFIFLLLFIVFVCVCDISLLVLLSIVHLNHLKNLFRFYWTQNFCHWNANQMLNRIVEAFRGQECLAICQYFHT